MDDKDRLLTALLRARFYKERNKGGNDSPKQP